MHSSSLKTILCILLLAPFCVHAQKEKQKVFTTTPTYDEIIATYAGLAKNSKLVQLTECGTTDIGKPLHLVVISKDGKFDPASAAAKTKIFINNGIHPGEPDGIDACIELTRMYVAHPELLPANVVLCIIPVFNIDGCLNRSSMSRANQNGPEEYGFRGNAKNLDLNRDFIKCDALNTCYLEQAFRDWKPDIFIDTHVSNGADYQYVLTVIESQRSKMNYIVSDYVKNKMLPSLYATMKEKKYEMCPYVDFRGETPESGIIGFLDTPRFSTGYTSLFNCISFVTETHMWKPYNDRVWATYEFLLATINFASKENAAILKTHSDADEYVGKQKSFTLNWQLDTSKFEWISFKGFEAKHKLSAISNQQRLYYDRNAPFTKQVKYFNAYLPVTTVTSPEFYIIPQAYTKVIEQFKINKIEMNRLSKDTAMKVEVYYIDDYKSARSPYESHYIHSQVKVSRDEQVIQYYKGDYVVQTNQTSNRYIVETLEPEGGDSFFAWNSFDGILQQKEWFSDYIFEEKADSLLKANPALKAQLLTKQKSDTAFAKDHWAQLYFIYSHSPYMEKTYNRYPVARMNQPAKLPVE